MKVDHISASQMKTWANCQATWMFRYHPDWQLIIPPAGKMMRGTCIHRALAHNYLPKIESHEDLPVDEVLDHYSTTFDEEANVTAWQEEEDKGDIKDGGIRVLECYHSTLAPTIQPVDVERKFRMELSWVDGEEPKQAGFEGVIDLVTDQRLLIDNKSTGTTPTEALNADKQQMTGYYLGKEALGEEPDKARLDYLVTLKTPKIVSYEVEVTQGQKKFLLGQIPKVIKQMESEIYVPNRNSLFCGETKCGYWNKCLEVFGG